MKRKIGLIVALILTVAGVVALRSDDAGALGKSSSESYCVIKTPSDDVYEKCVVVLGYFHKEETWSLENIKKHVAININDSYRTYGGITNDTIYNRIVTLYNNNRTIYLNKYGLNKDGIVERMKYCDSQPSGGQSACIASNGNPPKFSDKVGKELIPICYTDYWARFPAYCKGSNDGDDNSNNNGNNNNGNNGKMDTTVPGGNPDHCSTLFPDSWCNSDQGIQGVLRFIVAVLTGTVVIAGTVGIVICAVLILTARDNEQQLATGKKRLMQVVVGMIAWIMLAVIMNLLVPEPSSNVEVNTGVIKVESDEERTA